MTKTRKVMPPVGQGTCSTRTVNKHLLQLAEGAYAKAERSRRRWHRAKWTKPPGIAARLRQRMLKHQAIAYHLDTACRGCHEPR
jgi:uncharacterized lipoprotein YmbA